MLHILVVVNAGRNLLGSHLLGEHCRDDVGVLGLSRTYCNEEVCLFYPCLLKNGNGCRISQDSYNVRQFREFLQTRLVTVYDCYVIGLSAEHLGQMATNLSRTCYYNVHITCFYGAKIIRKE